MGEDVEMPTVQSEESEYEPTPSYSSSSLDSDSDSETKVADYETLLRLYNLKHKSTASLPITTFTPPASSLDTLHNSSMSIVIPSTPPPIGYSTPTPIQQSVKQSVPPIISSSIAPVISKTSFGIKMPVILSKKPLNMSTDVNLTSGTVSTVSLISRQKPSPIGELPIISFLCQNTHDIQKTQPDYVSCLELLINLDNERRRLQFIKNKEKTSQKIIEQLYSDVCLRLHQVVIEYNPLLSTFGDAVVYKEILNSSKEILLQKTY